ncbi:MAG: hypothetical protein CR994_04115 [Maribacter sp.]|nr:MAG: hypothetical protein CR994_04115 [Maribacter sp.]
MKKTFVLVILFVFPIVAYLFFASGINNFGKLPVLTENIDDITKIDSTITLEGKITILGFLGSDLENKKGVAFNLNQKIYKRFYEFNDFQFVMLVPKGNEDKVAKLKAELGNLADVVKWNFVYGEKKGIQHFFDGLGTDLSLDRNMATPYVFIIDKDKNLRGRTDDGDKGAKFGFDATSVAELNNKMEDDVKIVLAEYRMALKKNNADRKNR